MTKTESGETKITLKQYLGLSLIGRPSPSSS